MRLIDADKLQPDRMTNKGLAISMSQIANAPTYKECIYRTMPDEGVDCISRKAVLEMKKSYNTDGYDMYTPLVVDVEDIEELPSITPQERKGHWIRVSKDKLRCSECDIIHFIAQYPQGKIDWCPNCGADMREVEE